MPWRMNNSGCAGTSIAHRRHHTHLCEAEEAKAQAGPPRTCHTLLPLEISLRLTNPLLRPPIVSDLLLFRTPKFQERVLPHMGIPSPKSWIPAADPSPPWRRRPSQSASLTATLTTPRSNSPASTGIPTARSTNPRSPAASPSLPLRLLPPRALRGRGRGPVGRRWFLVVWLPPACSSVGPCSYRCLHPTSRWDRFL